jgi:hypothetical protein
MICHGRCSGGSCRFLSPSPLDAAAQHALPTLCRMRRRLC